MSRDPKKQERVIIVLPYVNKYRVSLLRALHDELARRNILLLITTGTPSGRDHLRSDAAQGYPSVTLKQFQLRFGGRFALLRLPPQGWISADLVVLEQAVKNLETYPIILIRKLFKKKTALWGHGMTITEPQSLVQRSIQRWMLRTTDWLFAYTEQSATRGVANGARSNAVTVLYNTFDTTDLIEAISERGDTPDSDGRWVATYIGGLDGSKRIDVLLRAAARLYELDPRFLLIVGGQGSMESEVRALSGQPWLEYLGSVGTEEKALLAGRSKIMMIPGRVGLAAIDSFAMATPIVTMAWEYHAPEFEYLTSTNSLVVHGDEAAYVSAIAELMKDKSRVDALSVGATLSAKDYPIARMNDNFADGIELSIRCAERLE
jgi:glycosyltransferase involved in cell wall biosynthesis